MERVTFKEVVLASLKDITDQLTKLAEDQKKGISSLTKKTSTIMTTLESLQAAVERDTAVDTSAITLIKGIADQLKETGGDKAKVEALTAKLNANADALAAAVAANTPATDPVPPTDVPA